MNTKDLKSEANANWQEKSRESVKNNPGKKPSQRPSSTSPGMNGLGWQRILLAISSAILLYLSFPPADLGVLAFFALVPLIKALRNCTLRQALNLGFMSGMLFFGLSLSWFANIFSFFAFPLWGVLAGFFTFFCLLTVTVCRSKESTRIPIRVPEWTLILAIAVLYTAVEFLRSELHPLRFTWMGLGYSQHKNLRFLNLVLPVVGVYGATFLIVLVNSLVSFSLR